MYGHIQCQKYPPVNVLRTAPFTSDQTAHARTAGITKTERTVLQSAQELAREVSILLFSSISVTLSCHMLIFQYLTHSKHVECFSLRAVAIAVATYSTQKDSLHKNMSDSLT